MQTAWALTKDGYDQERQSYCRTVYESKRSEEAKWYDWDFHMTQGDMSGYINMSNIAYGTTTASGSMDIPGKQFQGQATTIIPGIFHYSDRYDEEIETPFPYTIKVYGDQVVLRCFLHRAAQLP